MVMQDPHRVREEVTPRLAEALRILGQQVDLLNLLDPRLQACAQPSPAQLASHRGENQGDARQLRVIIAVLTNSNPHLNVVADLLLSALKRALDSGATRNPLPFLGHSHSQDQIMDYLLTIPRTTHASFHPNRFPVSIHIALASMRLAVDYHLDKCICILRRIGLPDRTALYQPADHAMVEARNYLAQANLLLSRVQGHIFDALYGHMLRYDHMVTAVFLLVCVQMQCASNSFIC
jgi:hypothetical protein